MDQTLELAGSFKSVYKGKRVFLTGHTGFKGSWMAFWLERLGADVLGYSLEAPTEPSHIKLLGLKAKSTIGNILDSDKLQRAIAGFQPEIVFHLAAQPLVRLSYKQPVETFETNAMGTVKVLEACRLAKSVKAIVVVTSDKCYENREWVWGYRENDPMGGYDPYSASKGCAELIAASYRNSYFNNADYGHRHNTLLASCRAGNVIGGGDWAEDRLVPDMMKAVANQQPVEIRNPLATRPWQHVLEPLSGYLLVGEKLLSGCADAATAWNFGPEAEGSTTVGELAGEIKRIWPKIDLKISTPKEAPHEANLLKLDCSKARQLLKWSPAWDVETTVEHTVKWYRDYYERKTVATASDLEDYFNDAKAKDIEWTR